MSVSVISKAIQERLRKGLITDLAIPLVEMVYSQRDYVAVPENNMVCPSIAVIYSGYTPVQTPGQAVVTAMNQQVAYQFLIVLNISNAGDTSTGEGVEDEVSPLFDACLELLLGFRPAPNFLPLKLDPAPGAAVSDAGFGYYPISFTTARAYRGKP